MTTKLILSKMHNNNTEKRPLCIAINRAVAHLEVQFGPKEAGSRLDIIEALAGAAARALTLQDIRDGLLTTPDLLLDEKQWCRENNFQSYRRRHPGSGTDVPKFFIDFLAPSSKSYIDSAPQDALIAALCTKRFQLAKRLLEDGMNATTKSPAFGLPLHVAAAMGAQEVVHILIDRSLAQGKEEDVGTTRIIKRARLSVLKAAAAGGHEHIVRMILDDLENDQKSLSRGLNGSIIAAVVNDHEDIASLLLQRRAPVLLCEPTPGTRSYGKERELEFWRELSKEAARYGCENVRKIALESVARVGHENNKPSEVEDTFLGGK